MISAYWLEKRKPYWNRLEQLVASTGRRNIRALSHREIQELALLYRQAASDLSRVREDPTGNELARYLNQLLGRAHNLIYMGRRAGPAGILHFYTREYPAIFRRTFPYVFAAFVLFAVGAGAGVSVAVELYLLWPAFMSVASQVIILPFFIEVFAFFVEAIFLGIYMYSWDRFKNPWRHWLASLPLVVASALSGFLITTVNAFMNAPAGFTLTGGQLTYVDPVAAMLNPAVPIETFHVLTACYVGTAFMLAALYAWKRVRGDTSAYVTRAYRLALYVGLPASILAAIGGGWCFAGATPGCVAMMRRLTSPAAAGAAPPAGRSPSGIAEPHAAQMEAKAASTWGTAGPSREIPVSRQGAIRRLGSPAQWRPTQSPVTKAIWLSTVMVLRWSRLSQPNALSTRGGLKHRTSTPARRSRRQKLHPLRPMAPIQS